MIGTIDKGPRLQAGGRTKTGCARRYVAQSRHPRPGYKPPNAEAKVFDGPWRQNFGSTSRTFQWVKVEATVIAPRFQLEVFSPRSSPGTTLDWRRLPSGRQHLASQAFCNEGRQATITLLVHPEVASRRSLLRPITNLRNSRSRR